MIAEDIARMNVEIPGQTSLQVMRTMEEVRYLRTMWTSLQRHPNADIDFYERAISTRPEFIRPHVIVLYTNGSPEVVLMGRLENRALDFRIGYGTLFSPSVRSLVFGYGGMVGNPSASSSDIVVGEILNTLRAGEADVAFVNHLRRRSPFYGSLTRLPGWLSRDYFPHFAIHRSLALARSANEFYSGLSAKVRKNQRLQAKKFVQDHAGGVQVRCLGDTPELAGIVGDVEAVAKKTYQRGLGVGFSDTPQMRQRLQLLAEKGWLRAYILYVGDKPCAFWVGTLYCKTFHSEFMGYDPGYSKYSPGMFLIMRVLEGMCDGNESDKIEEIDFGLGDAQYKEVLGNREWLDASVYLFAPNPKGIGLNLLRIPIMAADNVVRRALERTNLLARIKKAWRHVSAG